MPPKPAHGESTSLQSSATPSRPVTGVQLARFDNRSFQRGRPAVVEAIWILVQALFVRSFLPGSWHRVALLRAFGARIGRGVTVKPGVRVKFPWRLSVADHVWIGEEVWIDNLAPVRIESNACLSQGAYLCTGSHDWSVAAFTLITKPITIGESAWIGARASVGPGVTVGEGAVLTLGSAAYADLADWMVHTGAPATPKKARRVAP